MEETNDLNLKYINTECSPSYLFNNISTSDLNIYYIHNSEIQPRIIVVNKEIFNKDSTKSNLLNNVGKLNGNENLQISSIHFCTINSNDVIAVGLYGGFKVWNSDGNRLLYHLTDNSSLENAFIITSITDRLNFNYNNSSSSYNNFIVFGDSFGNIYQCSGIDCSWKNTKIYNNKDSLSVTCIASGDNNIIVSGFENGDLIVLDCTELNLKENELQSKHASLIKFFNNEFELPSISISFFDFNKYFASGLVNGEIRIYCVKSLRLISSIQSHSRIINSLSTYQNYIASCSDDCYINIFKFTNEKLNLTKSIKVPDRMPVGVKLFKDNNSISLVSCCYDSPNLLYYKL